MRPIWLTVDSDDIRHVPSSQGHPTRSKGIPHEGTSDEMLEAMSAFRKWLDRTQVTLTIFVIADQLDDSIFNHWLKDLLHNHPHLLRLLQYREIVLPTTQFVLWCCF